MQRLLIVMLLFSQLAIAQRGLLYVKKKGYHKVMTFAEGSPIKFETADGKQTYGMITLVRKDSIRVNNLWYHAGDIKRIILREKNSVVADLLYTTAGVGLSTAAIRIAKFGNTRDGFILSCILGYGNFIIHSLPKLKRKQYRIGKKFTVQTLDLRF